MPRAIEPIAALPPVRIQKITPIAKVVDANQGRPACAEQIVRFVVSLLLCRLMGLEPPFQTTEMLSCTAHSFALHSHINMFQMPFFVLICWSSESWDRSSRRITCPSNSIPTCSTRFMWDLFTLKVFLLAH